MVSKPFFLNIVTMAIIGQVVPIESNPYSIIILWAKLTSSSHQNPSTRSMTPLLFEIIGSCSSPLFRPLSSSTSFTYAFHSHFSSSFISALASSSLSTCGVLGGNSSYETSFSNTLLPLGVTCTTYNHLLSNIFVWNNICSQCCGREKGSSFFYNNLDESIA